VSSSVDLDVVARSAFSAVISDICDRLGYRKQSLAIQIQPRTLTDKVLVGWARPVKADVVDSPPPQPYDREIAFVDSLELDDVVVADCSESPDAFWGELFSSAALARGARGAVINGSIRDVHRIQAAGFPVHSASTAPTDSLGRLRILHQDNPITLGNVSISRGDLVVSDIDGTVIVPRAIATEVIRLAVEKASIETSALHMLQSGSLLRDVWEKHHVL
jgi:regulator of RNase E activity RraA